MDKEQLAYEYASKNAREGSDYHKGLERGFLDGFEAAEPKWIDVKERLPDSFSVVLIFTTVCLFPTLGYYAGKDWLYFSVHENFWLKNQPHIQVRYWQPLSEIPKTES